MKSEQDIVEAFARDGWKVTGNHDYQGKRGYVAENLAATNYETGAPKQAFYVEGDSTQMGYLMGVMAADTIEQMATQYMLNVIPSMVDPELEHHHILCEAIVDFLEAASILNMKVHSHDIPNIYIDEMKGLVSGCKAVNTRTKVTVDKLWTLNTAIDLLLASFYTGLGTSKLGEFLRKKVPEFQDLDIGTPLFCNGFVAFDDATESGDDCYFSRNFMLTDAGVFQDTAAMTIYVPDDEFEGRKPIPLVSMGAPGFVGSIATMNNEGIAVGVDIVPAANCAPARPGFNSLLLVRHAGQYAQSGDDAVSLISDAQRGVSWIYLIGDGKQKSGRVIEAGQKNDSLDPTSFEPAPLRNLLPNSAFLKAHPSGAPIVNGLTSRDSHFTYPKEYLTFNSKLFEYQGKTYDSDSQFIDKSYEDTNCPKTWYFAPTRTDGKSLVVTTNMFMVPEMRLCMMDNITVDLSEKPLAYMTAKTNYDDIQWRYDELTHQLLEQYGSLNKESVRSITSFLQPEGKYPGYYQKNLKSSDGKTCVIDGSLSICDLKTRSIESHYGYYLDSWVKLTLPDFCP